MGRCSLSRAPSALLGLALGLCTLEAAVCTVYDVAFVPEPGYVKVNAPGAPLVWGREGHSISHWEAHGVRRSPTPRDPDGDAVLVLGDSITEALQVADEVSFVAQAEARVRRAPRPRILNAGHSAFSVADYILHAQRNLAIFEPRWTVVVADASDFTYNAWDATKPRFATIAAGGLQIQAVDVETPAERFVGRFTPFTKAVPYAFIRLREHRAAEAKEPPLFRAGHVESTSSAEVERDYPIEAEAAMLAAAYQRRLSVVLLPRFLPAPPYVRLTATELRIRDALVAVGVRVVVPDAEFRALGARLICPYGFPNLAFNEGHLNADGHAAVAEALAREIDDALF